MVSRSVTKLDKAAGGPKWNFWTGRATAGRRQVGLALRASRFVVWKKGVMRRSTFALRGDDLWTFRLGEPVFFLFFDDRLGGLCERLSLAPSKDERPDRRARRDRRARLDARQRPAAAEREQRVRLLGSGRGERARVVERAAQIVGPVAPVDEFDRRRRRKRGQGERVVARAHQTQQRRPHEQEKCHEGRHRVARQAEDVRAGRPVGARGADAVEKWFARLDAHAPEVEAHPSGGEAFLDQIALADGHPARDDQRVVGVETGGEAGVEGGAFVGGAFEHGGRCAQRRGQRGQQRAVALVDFAGTERLTGGAEFVPRGEDRHARRAGGVDGRQPLRRQQTQARGGEGFPGGKEPLAAREVAPGAADVFAGFDGFAQDDLASWEGVPRLPA